MTTFSNQTIYTTSSVEYIHKNVYFQIEHELTQIKKMHLQNAEACVLILDIFSRNLLYTKCPKENIEIVKSLTEFLFKSAFREDKDIYKTICDQAKESLKLISDPEKEVMPLLFLSYFNVKQETTKQNDEKKNSTFNDNQTIKKSICKNKKINSRIKEPKTESFLLNEKTNSHIVLENTIQLLKTKHSKIRFKHLQDLIGNTSLIDLTIKKENKDLNLFHELILLANQHNQELGYFILIHSIVQRPEFSSMSTQLNIKKAWELASEKLKNFPPFQVYKPKSLC